MLLLVAAWAAVATVGTAMSGDGLDSVVFVALIGVACVAMAGSSRKRRLLGSNRPLGPLDRLERDHPVLVATIPGVVLGSLYGWSGGWKVGLLFGGVWVALQLVMIKPRAARRRVEDDLAGRRPVARRG